MSKFSDDTPWDNKITTFTSFLWVGFALFSNEHQNYLIVEDICDYFWYGKKFGYYYARQFQPNIWSLGYFGEFQSSAEQLKTSWTRAKKNLAHSSLYTTTSWWFPDKYFWIYFFSGAFFVVVFVGLRNNEPCSQNASCETFSVNSSILLD